MTSLTPAQRREDAEQHCLEQLHTTMQCMYLPVKLASHGASNLIVADAFDSAVTLMRSQLMEFQRELLALEDEVPVTTDPKCDNKVPAPAAPPADNKLYRQQWRVSEP